MYSYLLNAMYYMTILCTFGGTQISDLISEEHNKRIKKFILYFHKSMHFVFS